VDQLEKGANSEDEKTFSYRRRKESKDKEEKKLTRLLLKKRGCLLYSNPHSLVQEKTSKSPERGRHESPIRREWPKNVLCYRRCTPHFTEGPGSGGCSLNADFRTAWGGGIAKKVSLSRK